MFLAQHIHFHTNKNHTEHRSYTRRTSQVYFLIFSLRLGFCWVLLAAALDLSGDAVQVTTTLAGQSAAAAHKHKGHLYYAQESQTV